MHDVALALPLPLAGAAGAGAAAALMRLFAAEQTPLAPRGTGGIPRPNGVRIGQRREHGCRAAMHSMRIQPRYTMAPPPQTPSSAGRPQSWSRECGAVVGWPYEPYENMPYQWVQMGDSDWPASRGWTHTYRPIAYERRSLGNLLEHVPDGICAFHEQRCVSATKTNGILKSPERACGVFPGTAETVDQ